MMRFRRLRADDSFPSHSKTRLVSSTTVVASVLLPIKAITRSGVLNTPDFRVVGWGSRAITRLLAPLKVSPALLSSLLVICFAGACAHSRVIEVTVTNTSNEKVSNIAIEYPEASFGINFLDPGKSYQYKIKPTNTGPLKIEFLNARGANHVSKGPEIHKGDEGSINLKLTQEGATSEVKLN